MFLAKYITAAVYWVLLLQADLANAAAADITSAFQISFGVQGGNCASVGKDGLNTIFKDCLTLANAGLDVVSEYAEDEKAKRLLDGFFGAGGDLTSDFLNDISGYYLEIKNWIESPKGLKGGNKPWLFCHHTCLQRLDMNSQARDKNGDLMTDVHNDPLKIKDVPEYLQTQKDETAALKDPKTGRGKTAFPYYSQIHTDYIYDQTYGGLSKGYCDGKDNEGATSHRLSTTTMTLCPKTFNYRGLHSGSFTPHRRADIVDGSIPKDAPVIGGNNLPSSVTMFHELFHAVLGNDVTYPTLGEEYALAGMLKLGVQESLKNPETFTRVAAAWDYTKNSANGVEFYPGYAVVN